MLAVSRNPSSHSGSVLVSRRPPSPGGPEVALPVADHGRIGHLARPAEVPHCRVAVRLRGVTHSWHRARPPLGIAVRFRVIFPTIELPDDNPPEPIVEVIGSIGV